MAERKRVNTHIHTQRQTHRLKFRLNSPNSRYLKYSLVILSTPGTALCTSIAVSATLNTEPRFTYRRLVSGRVDTGEKRTALKEASCTSSCFELATALVASYNSLCSPVHAKTEGNLWAFYWKTQK